MTFPVRKLNEDIHMNHRIWLGIVLACLIAAPTAMAQKTDGSAEAVAEQRQKERLIREMDMRRASLGQAEEQLDQTYQQLRKLQSELREATGRADLAPEGLQKAASRLDAEKES